MTPVITATTVITIVVPNAHLNTNFWWSASSTPAKPINKKVDAVSGLNGNPVVICPSIDA